MKKFIAFLLVITMVACLFAGCGSPDESTADSADTATPSNDTAADTDTDTASDETDTAAEDPKTVDYSTVKIGILLSNTVTDGGWNQAMYTSLQRAQEELGMSKEQIIPIESLSEGGAEADATIVQLIDDGCNLIIGASSGFVTNIDAAYANYPEVYFAQFEGASGDNYCAFSCYDIEALFMCGYAAALMSEVDELGYVAPQPQTSVIRGINAFASGAKAANPNATVQITWVNSWYDPAGEKECANSLLQTGIQCLGYNGSTTAVCQAAAEAGGYCTGYNIDMHDYAPSAVLTSFVWNWAPQFKQIITEVATGTWTSEIKIANMADGSASLAPWNEEIMPEDVIDQCEQMYQSIIDGQTVVMGGPQYDQDGNELLAEGEQFTLDELINCYWLLDNVIGDLP